MEKSKVYFTDFRTKLGEGLPTKLQRLIRAAGIGAVMCNGEAHTLSFADYVTTNDNNHSGVAEVIRRFLLRK